VLKNKNVNPEIHYRLPFSFSFTNIQEFSRAKRPVISQQIFFLLEKLFFTKKVVHVKKKKLAIVEIQFAWP